nr:CNT_HP1_G0029830.mRNA.1.CDS.1 [Saccharomyces cerevisiae]
MHTCDQLALGVTPSKVPHWTAFLSMLMGLFYNKHFGRNWNIFWSRFRRCGCYHIGLIWQTLKFSLQITPRADRYMLMVAVHKELDSDDVPDGRFDIILLCRDSSREVGE